MHKIEIIVNLPIKKRNYLKINKIIKSTILNLHKANFHR